MVIVGVLAVLHIIKAIRTDLTDDLNLLVLDGDLLRRSSFLNREVHLASVASVKANTLFALGPQTQFQWLTTVSPDGAERRWLTGFTSPSMFDVAARLNGLIAARNGGGPTNAAQ